MEAQHLQVNLTTIAITEGLYTGSCLVSLEQWTCNLNVDKAAYYAAVWEVPPCQSQTMSVAACIMQSLLCILPSRTASFQPASFSPKCSALLAVHIMFAIVISLLLQMDEMLLLLQRTTAPACPY